MNTIKLLFTGKFVIVNYLFYSIVVTLVDTGIVWALVRFSEIHLVAANTIGVVSGFLLHYLLASKSVFQAEYGIVGFLVYLSTFIFGLALANWLIYMSYQYVFFAYSVNLRILLSKGISIAVPFFVLYYLRKHLFLLSKRKGW